VREFADAAVYRMPDGAKKAVAAKDDRGHDGTRPDLLRAASFRT